MSTSGVAGTEAAAAASASVSASRRCAACKQLRRKCSPDCVLAPHFPASGDPRRYDAVQKVFGAGNVARMLQCLPVEERGRAADAMAEEARRRAEDPVYGCAGVINRLQEEIHAVQRELARTRAQIVMHRQARRPPPPPPPPPSGAPQSDQLVPVVPGQLQQDDEEHMAPFQGLDDILTDF